MERVLYKSMDEGFLAELWVLTNSLITEKNDYRLTINFYKSSERGRVPLALPSPVAGFKIALQAF